METFVTKPGEFIDFETTFTEHPDLRCDVKTFFETYPADVEPYIKESMACAVPQHVPAHEGRIERIDYTTSVYEDGITYNKFCNVYLPWCYDPADREKRYNVIYFQHGNTGDPGFFAYPIMKQLLDDLFEMEKITPCICVFTTYYFDVTKDVETRRKTGRVPAGDGGWPGIKGNFYREVVEDIIPAVELKYNTYLTDSSDDAKKATRDHRVFSGYSRGSSCTWYMFHHSFEYFRWYMPMSCPITAGRHVREEIPEDVILDYLRQPVLEHKDLPFYIYASCGVKNDISRMITQMRYVTKAPGFSFGLHPEKGDNIYFALTKYWHGEFFVPQLFYNALPVIFPDE